MTIRTTLRNFHPKSDIMQKEVLLVFLKMEWDSMLLKLKYH
jgi:hypothetical protein